MLMTKLKNVGAKKMILSCGLSKLLVNALLKRRDCVAPNSGMGKLDRKLENLKVQTSFIVAS